MGKGSGQEPELGDEAVTVKEAAARAGVSRQTIERWMREKNITAEEASKLRPMTASASGQKGKLTSNWTKRL
jgi:excisionase family DNA binding protein